MNILSLILSLATIKNLKKGENISLKKIIIVALFLLLAYGIIIFSYVAILKGSMNRRVEKYQQNILLEREEGATENPSFLGVDELPTYKERREKEKAEDTEVPRLELKKE